MKSCEAFKADGEQCTRQYKVKTAEGKHFCTQHAKCKAVKSVAEPEPWETLRLPEPDPRNGKRYIQKVRKMLSEAPGKKREGHIYIYFLPREKTLRYWKIGLTERTVEERMQEWSAKYTLEVYTTFRVATDVYYVESLIHLYLTYCRIYRYPSKRGFQSVYKLKPSVVIQDGQQAEQGERVVAKNKQIEWFCEDIEEILKVVKAIIKAKG